jgi:hypothetical protein
VARELEKKKKITHNISFFITLNYYYWSDNFLFAKNNMITVFKLRITTEIKDQQRMKFFRIKTSQIIMNNELLERRRFMENKIIKILFFNFFIFLLLQFVLNFSFLWVFKFFYVLSSRVRFLHTARTLIYLKIFLLAATRNNF